MDYDPQGSSLRWVKKRKPAQAHIHVIAAFEKDVRTTRAFHLRPPDDTTHVIVDTPAALTAAQLPDMVRDAAKIIVPVLPSDIDIHTCSRCIRDLLLVAKIRREDDRIGVIANRVRRNTLTYQSLIRFLHTLGIPIVATLRDSQNYVRAAELGVGVHEMKSYVAREDTEQWAPLVEWLARPRPSSHQAPGRRRAQASRCRRPRRRRRPTRPSPIPGRCSSRRWRSCRRCRRPFPTPEGPRRAACAAHESGRLGWRRGRRRDRGKGPLAGGRYFFGLFGAVPSLASQEVAHLLGPALVVGPGVEIARDRGLARPGALHAVQPVGVGIRAAAVRWRSVLVRAAERARRLAPCHSSSLRSS